MNLGSTLSRSLEDTLTVSVPLFRPELCLVATIILLLLCRMLPGFRRLDSGLLALGGVGFATWYAWGDLLGLSAVADGGQTRQEIFSGLLVFDPFTAYVRMILCGFLVLYVIMTRVTGIPDREDGADFYTLVLGA